MQPHQYNTNDNIFKRTETNWLKVAVTVAYPIYFVYSQTHNIFLTLIIPTIILFLVVIQVDFIYLLKKIFGNRKNKNKEDDDLSNFLLPPEEEEILGRATIPEEIEIAKKEILEMREKEIHT